MDTAVDAFQTEYHHSGLHQQKSKVQLKLWSDSQRQSAVILKIMRSAKHHSVCTSGGCQQLTDDCSVMKLCLHQPAGSSRSIVFQTSPDFLDFLNMTFWGSYPGAPSAAGSCSYQTPAPHINIFQKVRTKIWDWSELTTNPGFWMLNSLLPGVSLSWSILAGIEFLSKAMQRHLAWNAAWNVLQLWALSLATGVEDVEYLTKCIMLHKLFFEAWIVQNDQLGASRSTHELRGPRSTHENAPKFENFQVLGVHQSRFWHLVTTSTFAGRNRLERRKKAPNSGIYPKCLFRKACLEHAMSSCSSRDFWCLWHTLGTCWGLFNQGPSRWTPQ